MTNQDRRETRRPPPPPRVTTGRPPPAGVVLIGMSVAVWWPAFTLGAWGTLFFDQLLTAWVASTAALVVVVLQRARIRAKILRGAALLVPSVWLVLAFATERQSADDLAGLVDVVAAIVAFLGIPFTAWTLARIVWPDLGDGLSRWTKVIVVVTVAALTVGVFELGVHQDEFLTCEDFAVSGNSEPAHCRHDPDAGSASPSAREISLLPTRSAPPTFDRQVTT